MMKGLLALLLAALMVVGSARAQDAAAAVDPNGWVKEIATANKLLAAGYTDAAQKDFESVIQRYAANSAGIDRAWLGLSKIHMAKYDYDQAKVSLEEVLRRNSDPEAVTGAKTTYRQLKQEADGQAQQAQKAVQFLEQQYAYTSWLNPFAKLFTYLDLKKARTAAETALAASNGYDPHYFIDDVAASAIATPAALSGSEFQPAGLDTPATGAASSTAIAATGAAAGVSVHAPASSSTASHTTTAAASITGATSVAGVNQTTSTVTAAASIVVSPTPAPVATTTPTPVPSPIVISTSGTTTSTAAASATATPAASATASAAEPDLITLQRGYQESYRKLQEAIAMGNQSRIVLLNAEYQKALEAYRKAAASGRR